MSTVRNIMVNWGNIKRGTILLIFLFLVQIATVCIIFMINPRQETNRLFVFFLLFAFSVDLFWAIVDSILPYIPSQLDSSMDINLLLLHSHFKLDMVGNPGAAYTFLMFAIAISRMVSLVIWRILAISLYIPVFLRPSSSRIRSYFQARVHSLANHTVACAPSPILQLVLRALKNGN